MDNKILYSAKFTHHDLIFHKVRWKSEKRCGSWSGQTDKRTDRQTGRFIYAPQTMIDRSIIIFWMGLTDQLKIGLVCRFKMKYVHLVSTV